ncbi:ATP-binding response regulator [Halopseudomonas maritima]|uniref:ATP-binding response regulator n=1 Tax=Halopseudomonas maritima TaxID=2918528 RepID=UPI001EEC1D3D|nr:hybrid sensor histidine kinase/response regulator [Halopseudomonas maritima]UJJ32030.1 hybrid sensor histidine kinase/response regulator [Halopseudomonas maritima]
MNSEIPPAVPGIDEPALLAQQRGFARLRFRAPLEQAFQHYLHGKMASRVGLVALSSIAFMLLFMWLDYLYLPPEVARYTLSIRSLALLLVCLAIWYSNRPGRVLPRRAFDVATLAYCCSGLMVVMVITVARLAEVPIRVTHDGLYLVLLSGFFLLALPMRHAVLGSWLIVLSYLAAEQLTGSSPSVVISDGIFLSNFALMGSLGAYIYEYMQRRGYLNEQLLEAARRRAERESQSKTHFLATASHDLRQPLHAMLLFIQHLQDQVLNDEARRTVERLTDSTQLLQAMLNSLLDISRLSVGMVRPQTRSFNLRPWLERLVASLESYARRRGIRLEIDCAAHVAVQSDPMLLERLLRNYLNNALIHAEASLVRIEVTRMDERLRIAVVDNGCGLADADQERIFEEFTQLRNPARTLDKGVGLGLSICRQILHLLTYPSGLWSRLGEGARFWFEVPVGAWQSEPAEPQMAPMPGLRGQVALIENDRVSREAMQALLSSWGCIVWAFASADDAIEGLREVAVDVLLSDFRLEGELNGLELIRHLRERELYGGPAALVTADTSEELAEAARLADIQLLYKPVLPPRLRRTVQGMLAQAPAHS